MIPKSRFFLLAFLLAFFSVNAQNIYIKTKNGNTENYPLSEVRKITFSGGNMILLKRDGQPRSWSINSIANYRYDASTNIREVAIRNADFTIYPNPFRGRVNIRYELTTADKVAVEIFDLQGRSIQKWPLTRQNAGTHELMWQANDVRGMQVPSGTYVCRITTSNGAVSKMLVLE